MLVFTLASLLLVCGLGDTRAAQPSAVVTESDEPAKFLPARVVVKAGQTVEWKNTGHLLHSATNDSTKAAKPEAVSSPSGADPFDSGFMMPGAIYQHAFTVPGTYRYLCLPHQAQGMVGEVVVLPR